MNNTFRQMQDVLWPKLSKSRENVRYLIVCLILVNLIILPRWYYVENFAMPLPYWDQWDAEGNGLLHAWIEGRLHISDLWPPHNEHRVFPTRIMTLLCFELTGVWSNLVETRVNILLASATPLLLIWLLYRLKELKSSKWLVVGVIIALATFPFAWENTLTGFQSQFYFLIFFTLSSFTLAALRPDKIWAFSWVVILCMLNVVTMASGMLTPLAVFCVYGLQWFVRKKISLLKLLSFTTLLVLIAASGYLILPHVPAHDRFHAKNLSELFFGFVKVLSWPSRSTLWAAIPLWLPAFIALPVLTIRKNLKPFDLIMAGCFLWTLAQALAIGYGRAGELDQVTSRYTDLFCPGLISTGWFSLRLVAEFKSRLKVGAIVIAVIFYGTFFRILLKRTRDDITDMKHHYQLSLIQTRNVSNYLRTGNIAALDQPQFEIPYPRATDLAKMLDDTILRPILPQLTPERPVLENSKR